MPSREVFSMMVLDTNYILRYLLRDNEEMFLKAKVLIEREDCLILNEVLAEAVYVLQGVYKVPKETVVKTLSELLMLDNLFVHEDKAILLNALIFYQSHNLDYVDCYLCALSAKYPVRTFDKKLQRCVNNI